MQELSFFYKLLVWAIPLIFAIVFHEVAHGWVAYRFGDPTAKQLGRLSLNPIKHIDLVGTIIVPAILIYLGGFIFGWAKPVPVNWKNLKNQRRDMALVALAGPFTNLIMAFIWALITKLGISLTASDSKAGLIIANMGAIGIAINLVLFVLNLIPIPPLDGSRVVTSILPDSWVQPYNKLEPFGFLILLALIATGVLTHLMAPLIYTLQLWIANLFGF